MADAEVGPAALEGGDDDGIDDALDVGLAGVMGAELASFGRVERPLEEGAEDGGFDL